MRDEEKRHKLKCRLKRVKGGNGRAKQLVYYLFWQDVLTCWLFYPEVEHGEFWLKRLILIDHRSVYMYKSCLQNNRKENKT